MKKNFMLSRNGQGLLQKKDSEHRILEHNLKYKNDNILITGDKEEGGLNIMTRSV